MTALDKTLASRRSVLKGVSAAGAGLVVGVYMPGKARAESGAAAVMKQGSDSAATFAPNAFVRIAPNNTVTVLSKHIEFGQGPYTGLATLVAEELDADWSQMRAESAPADMSKYKNTAFGVQGTGGSTAIANSYEQMRKAGAAARAMIVEAAADQWSVPAAEITVDKGVVSHAGSGKSATLGELSEAAAKVAVPNDVKLKDPKDFKLIGTNVPKLDSDAKSTGKADFTIDFQADDLLTVLVARAPRFGAKLKSVDASKAESVKGVVAVKEVPTGVAVFAKSYWAAKKGRDALDVTWDNSGAEMRSSSEILSDYRKALAEDGGVDAAKRGDPLATLDKSERTFEAEFAFPLLAHAPMEPNDCVIEMKDGGVELWLGSQLQTVDQTATAQVLGLRPENVKINTLFAGGSFGRRATPTGQVVTEAAHCAKAFGKTGQKLKVIWSREDDITGGYYRPIVVHKVRAALSDDNVISAWDQTIVSQSIIAGGPFEQMMKDGVDPTMVEGANDMPYAIPNFRVLAKTQTSPLTVLWWRSVGHTHTAYVVETFLDELLAAAGKDAVEGRLELLGDKYPRETGVLKEVARISNWGSASVPEGRARGVALHKSFGSYVAQVAEVSKGDDEGMPRVHKVWCAVDCGVPINPNVITAQMEGGIGFGLGAILFNAITLDKGEVQETNFDKYRSLRIDEMPDVEVSIIKSAEAPTGVGEPGTPPIGPAVANAWAKLTGTRVRQLPFTGGSV